MSSWIDWLRQCLCKLYAEWGGDCADLGKLPHDWATTVVDEYESAGVPNLPSQSDKDRCLAELQDLENCLSDSQNSLDPSDTKALRAVAAALEAAIGGQGGGGA